MDLVVFLASRRETADEEVLKGLGVLDGFWGRFFRSMADLSTVRNKALIRAYNRLINSGPLGKWEAGKVGGSAWALLGLGSPGCRSAHPGGETQAPRMFAKRLI